MPSKLVANEDDLLHIQWTGECSSGAPAQGLLIVIDVASVNLVLALQAHLD